MPSAEIIAIGTELLLGEIQDTNTQFIARAFREKGINIFRTMIVGDNSERIMAAVKEAMGRADIIITTGGLGPTIDDPTRSAIANVFESELVFYPEIWENIRLRVTKMGRTAGENQKRQAFIPKIADIIDNPVGTAPAFLVKTASNTIISLPGVPIEMETILVGSVIPLLQKHYQLHETLFVHTLHTSGAGEGWIDEKIGDLEELSNPTIGLSAHAGIVDIRITARAPNVSDASKLIRTLEEEIKERLGDHIFGSDEETLEGITLEAVSSHCWTIYSIEEGTKGLLNEKLNQLKHPLYNGGITIDLAQNSLLNYSEKMKKQNCGDVILGLSVTTEENRNRINLVITTPDKNFVHQVVFSGSSQIAPELGINLLLDRLRRMV